MRGICVAILLLASLGRESLPSVPCIACQSPRCSQDCLLPTLRHDHPGRITGAYVKFSRWPERGLTTELKSYRTIKPEPTP